MYIMYRGHQNGSVSKGRLKW